MVKRYSTGTEPGWVLSYGSFQTRTLFTIERKIVTTMDTA